MNDPIQATSAEPIRPKDRVDFKGRAGDITGLVLLNAVLTVVTLGFYRFWARTNVRRALWGHTEIDGEPLEYTGTGRELFIGFLIVFFFFILPVVAINVGAGIAWEISHPELVGLVNVVIILAAGFLVGMAIYRARRYRLSRTVWRGVRAGQTGSSALYALKFFGLAILNFFTLGWLSPYRTMVLNRQTFNNTWFGDRQMKFDGRAADILGPFAIAWFFSGISFGLAYLYYKAKEFEYTASRLSLDDVRFKLDVDMGHLFVLVFVNYLIVVFTLGFGLPWAQMRTFRFVCESASLDGELDLEAIRQSMLEKPGVGEGLADAFDLGSV